MNAMLRGITVFALAAATFGAALPARADVSVSVTLTGPIEEILPILQLLEDLGVGSAAYSEDPLQLRVQSDYQAEPNASAPAEADTPPADEEPAPEPEPVAGFSEPSLEPAQPAAGEEALVTVRLNDPDGAVDTVSASFGDAAFDLYDNGSNGDATAADGVWSARATLPAGEGPLVIQAHDDFGDPVSIEGAGAMKTQIDLNVAQGNGGAEAEGGGE